MLSRQKLMVALALVMPVVSASAASVYVINGSQQFGTVDVATGAFQQIGPNTPEGEFGLVAGPNGSLITLTYAGNLDSIDPVTGVVTLIGPTGLADCSTPDTSTCGPTSANGLGALDGKIYATDYQNNLYGVNTLTGGAALIGPSGMPAIPFIPGSFNTDGTINLYDESIFAAGGKLYGTFDAFVFDLVSFSVSNITVAPSLYQIDLATGAAKIVGPTELGIAGVADVNGTYFGFDDLTEQVVSLDLANGNTSFVTNFDPAAGVIQGASPVAPEPASIALAGVGMVAIIFFRQRELRLSLKP